MAEPRLLAEDPPLRGMLRGLVPFMRPDRGLIAVAVLTSLAAAAALVAVAPAVGWATDAILAADPMGLLTAALVLLGLALLHPLLAWGGEVLLATAGERVVRRIRDTVTERIAVAPLRFLEENRAGDLTNRATAEVAHISTFVRAHLPGAVATSALLVFSLIVLLAYSWVLTLLMMIAFLPGALLVMRSFERASGPAWSAEAAAGATVAATFTESLDAREMLQQHGATALWTERYRVANADLLTSIRATIRALNRMPLIVVVECLTTAVLVGAGVLLIVTGDVGIGTVVVFVVATRGLFDAFGEATALVGQLQESRVGVARMLDLLRASADEPPHPVPPRRGELVVDGVSFGYVAGTEVLSGVSVRIAPGQRVALAGPTGSGKSTLAKVMVGLYRPDAGAVRYGGIDLALLPAEQLRPHLALIAQRPHVVPGSLLDNLALVPGGAERERVESAVAELGLQAWVTGLGGLDADLGERGDRLSAGEQQLVGLVRAAVMDAAVLVLDEATADVDPTLALYLETALDRIRGERSLVVIAHRQETVDRMPRVVRLSEGRVADAELDLRLVAEPTTASHT